MSRPTNHLDLDDIMDVVEQAEDANHEYQNAEGGSIAEAKAHVALREAREAIGKAFEDLRIENKGLREEVTRLKAPPKPPRGRECWVLRYRDPKVADPWMHAHGQYVDPGATYEVVHMREVLPPESETAKPTDLPGPCAECGHSWRDHQSGYSPCVVAGSACHCGRYKDQAKPGAESPTPGDDLPPIGTPQMLCRECGRPTEPGNGFYQCHPCKRLWPHFGPASPTVEIPVCPDCDCSPCACLIDREEPGEFAKPVAGDTVPDSHPDSAWSKKVADHNSAPGKEAGE